MSDPTIFPVIITTLIIAVIAYFQNMKWVSGAVLVGCISYIIIFSPDSSNNSTTNDDLAPDTIVSFEEKIEDIDKTEPAIAIENSSDTNTNNEELTSSIDNSSAVINVDSKNSSELSPILINEMNVCREVSGRQPIGIDERFPSTVESLSCFTSIRNLNPEKQTIIHEWRLEGELMSRVSMDLYFSYNWRCWSQVSIDPEREGNWTVSVKDTLGNILEERAFVVVSTDLY